MDLRKHLCLVGTALFAFSCRAVQDQSAIKSADGATPPATTGLITGMGGHDILPPKQREVALARAEDIEHTAPSSNFSLADEPPGRHRCSSALEDVNCYWDACAAELGGALENNYLPETIDPRKPDVGEVIQTYWNGKLIAWQPLNGVWQYTFDDRPGAADWPEKGAGLQAPVTDAASLKCDWMQQNNPTTCLPGQKRMELKRGDVRYQFLFRRNAPPQPDVPQDSPFNLDNWGNIALLAFRTSESDFALPDGSRTKASGVCWLNTFNNTNSGKRKIFPLPVPGGRFGNSPAEEQRRQRVIDFWDVPAQHRTLSAVFGGIVSNAEGENCVTCHGNGPILDAVWYREKQGESSGDDKIPFYSVAGLHNPRTFWKVGGSCAGCHKFFAERSDTCFSLTREYTTLTPSPLASLFRRGFENTEPEATVAPQAPATAKMKAAHTMLMPDPFDDEDMTVDQYEAKYRAAINEILACCEGGASCARPKFTVKPPRFVGAQDPVPKGEFAQRIPPPTEADGLTAARGSCSDGKCEFKISWRDPASRFLAPETYKVSLAATAADTDAFCRSTTGETIPVNATPGEGWSNSYEATVTVQCATPQLVRVCGISSGAAQASFSEGRTANLSCN